jgi:F0F1-type ATP synthase assembly protein I
MAGSETPSNLGRYAIVGFELSSPIIGGAIAGYFADKYFHRTWLSVLFLLGGIFLGFYRMIVEVRNIQKNL